MSQNVKEAWGKVEKFDEKKAIEDPILLKKSLMVFLLTISVFIFHHNLGLEAATVALAGATLLVVYSLLFYRAIRGNSRGRESRNYSMAKQ